MYAERLSLSTQDTTGSKVISQKASWLLLNIPTSQSQPSFAVLVPCSDVLSTEIGKRHMQHTHPYARKSMCFPTESFVT